MVIAWLFSSDLCSASLRAAEGTLPSPAWTYADKNRNSKFLGHFSLGASRLFWILNYRQKETCQVCVSCRSWTRGCPGCCNPSLQRGGLHLIREHDGADVAKPLCSQPSEGEDQQLIWTDKVDFIALVAVCCCCWGGSSVQPLSCVSTARVWPGLTAGARNRGHTLYPRIFIILSGPIYFQASVQPFMQDENNSFSCFLPEHWRSSGWYSHQSARHIYHSWFRNKQRRMTDAQKHHSFHLDLTMAAMTSN